MAFRQVRAVGASARRSWAIFAAVVVVASVFVLPSAASQYASHGPNLAPAASLPTTARPESRQLAAPPPASAKATPDLPSASAGVVTRTIFPGFNTSLPGSFTSSVGAWTFGSPTYVPTTDTLWFPQRSVSVPGYPYPSVAPAAVFNLSTGGFDRLVTNLSNASALAYDPGNGDIYATIPALDSVVAIDPRTGAIVASQIPVGSSPAALAFDPNADHLFVANSGSSNVTVIDTVDNKVSIDSVPVGTDPVSLAFDPQDELVFVANGGTNAVSVINATNPSAPLPKINLVYGDASEVAYSPQSDTVVAAVPASDFATVIDASVPAAIRQDLPVGTGITAAVASANGTEFVLANSTGTDVVILNSSAPTSVTDKIAVYRNATQLALNPESGLVYCWTSASRVLEALNLSTNVATPATSTAFPAPVSLTYLGGVDRAYAASTDGSMILGLDPTRLEQDSVPIVTAALPLSVVADASTGRLYVGTSNGVDVYNAFTGNLIGTVASLTGNCTQLVLDHADNFLWLENTIEGVDAVNLTTLRVEIPTGVVTPPGAEQGIAVDSFDSEVFILVSLTSVTVLSSRTGVVLAPTVIAGTNVTSLAFDATDDQIYAAGDAVSLVDGVSLAVDGGPIALGGEHRVLGAVYESSREDLYIATTGLLAKNQGAVTVIDGSSVPAGGLSTTEIPVGVEPDAFGIVPIAGAGLSGLATIWVANELSGTISVLSTPPTITYFASTPNIIERGQSTAIEVAFQGGAGTVTIAFRGIPSGCSSMSLTSMNCTPTSTGVFRLTVNVTDSLGVTANASTTLTVLSALALSTAFSPSTFPTVDVGVPLVGTMTGSDGLPPYAFVWEFGDGNHSTGPKASHAYTRPGIYALTAAVWDSAGATANSSIAVDVVPVASVAIVLHPGNVTDVDFPVSLSASVTGGTGPSQQNWTFGDGTEALGGSAVHAWTRPGSYDVTFGYIDSLGVVTNRTVTIIVHPGLTATFSSENASATEPAAPAAPVTFSSSILGGTPPYSLTWSFGDGAMGSGESVTHRYASEGTYTVGVTLIDAVGATVQTNLSIVVASTSSSGGGFTSLAGGFGSGLFLGLLLGGVLAAVVLFAARPRKGQRPPENPVLPYVPP